MANATDRLNQLQQYMDYYRGGGGGTNPFHGQFGSPSQAQWGGNPYGPNNSAMDWAQSQIKEQEAMQQQEDQNSMFKGMYAGNGQSQFGAPPAYVQPQNQQQQPNPYSARAMQLNGGGQNGGQNGSGQNGGNTLADMFRNYNKGG